MKTTNQTKAPGNPTVINRIHQYAKENGLKVRSIESGTVLFRDKQGNTTWADVSEF